LGTNKGKPLYNPILLFCNMSLPWIDELKDRIKGDVLVDKKTLQEYSRDASIYEVKPQVVVFPKDIEDVKNLVNFVNQKKEEFPDITLTGRSAGTDMTGGPLTTSIVVCFTKYINQMKELHEDRAVVEPGLYYRDFEKEMDKIGVMYPSYPASKSICAMGGIIANNSGGEKTLTYKKTQQHVNRIRVVLSDGNECELKPLNMDELNAKKSQDNFEGHVYREIHKLIEENYDIIKNAKPDVPKNSAGYYLWDVWDREKGIFDLTQVFVGCQGTLGLWLEAEVDVVKKHKYSRLVIVFLKKIEKMANLVNLVLPYKPESLEAFDDETLKLAIRFMPDIAKKVNRNLVSFLWDFRHEGLMALRHGFPVFIILVEITGDDLKEVLDRQKIVSKLLKKNGMPNRALKTQEEGEKYWVMRRQSFSLLREKVHDKRATPFIDDFDVKPEELPKFLPELYALLKEYDIKPTLAGHAGSGNFHIIPLMDLEKESERQKIPEVEEKFTRLVLKYHGTITAEHNDGMVRTKYLEEMYGSEIMRLFERTKDIFDPKGIFNPHKKVRPDWDFAMAHIKAKPD